MATTSWASQVHPEAWAELILEVTQVVPLERWGDMAPCPRWAVGSSPLHKGASPSSEDSRCSEPAPLPVILPLASGCFQNVQSHEDATVLGDTRVLLVWVLVAHHLWVLLCLFVNILVHLLTGGVGPMADPVGRGRQMGPPPHSRVFSNSTVQKHQFFGAQPSVWSSSHSWTWHLRKPWLWLCEPLLVKQCLCFLICCLGLSQLFS